MWCESSGHHVRNDDIGASLWVHALSVEDPSIVIDGFTKSMDGLSITDSMFFDLFIPAVIVLEIERICSSWTSSKYPGAAYDLFSIGKWIFGSIIEDSWLICCKIVHLFEYVLLSTYVFI